MKRDSGQYLGWNAFPNRKADLIRCYHHPHPPQAVPPTPRGRGLFDVKNYFSRRGRRDFEDGHPTSRESVISGRVDSATSPSAPRRMTGMGDILRRVKVFVPEKPGVKESNAMRIGC